MDILEKRDPLAVAYAFSKEKEREYIQFIFYGGILDDGQIKNIKVDGEEVVEYKFVKVNENRIFPS